MRIVHGGGGEKKMVIDYCNKHVHTAAAASKAANSAAGNNSSTAASGEVLKNSVVDFIKVDQATLFDLILVRGSGTWGGGSIPGLGSSKLFVFVANKGAACYKNKVLKNWEAITTIYSKDHANGEGAKTAAESAVDQDTQGAEDSPDLPQKRQRTGDAILCMLGDMRTSFQDALKTTEPLALPQVTPPAEILVALEMIPDLARSDLLKAYGKLILSERLFQALMELPMALRKEWLMTLN